MILLLRTRIVYTAGMDELDLLLSMRDASSRPSTAASASTSSSRPATIQGHSRLVHAYPHADSILMGVPQQRSHANRSNPAAAGDFEATGGSYAHMQHQNNPQYQQHHSVSGGDKHEAWARPSSSDLTSSRRLRSAGRAASSSSSLDAGDHELGGPGGRDRDRTLAEEREILRARKHQYTADREGPSSPLPRSPQRGSGQPAQRPPPPDPFSHHQDRQPGRGATAGKGSRDIKESSGSFIDFSEFGF